jgi:hypothetical protein
MQTVIIQRRIESLPTLSRSGTKGREGKAYQVPSKWPPDAG